MRARNNLPIWEDFSVDILSANGSLLENHTIIDPRAQFPQPGGPLAKWKDDKNFTLVFGFHENVRTVELYNQTDNLLIKIDLAEDLLEFCGNIGYNDSDCQTLDLNNDGIKDYEDECPLVFGCARYNGCLLGNVNDDGIVDIVDVTVAALAFGSYPGYPNWNPNVDLKSDAVINIFDLIIIGVNFGKSCYDGPIGSAYAMEIVKPTERVTTSGFQIVAENIPRAVAVILAGQTMSLGYYASRVRIKKKEKRKGL